MGEHDGRTSLVTQAGYPAINPVPMRCDVATMQHTADSQAACACSASARGETLLLACYSGRSGVTSAMRERSKGRSASSLSVILRRVGCESGSLHQVLVAWLASGAGPMKRCSQRAMVRCIFSMTGA